MKLSFEAGKSPENLPPEKERTENHSTLHCTLCRSDHLKYLSPENDYRNYYLCCNCDLIFVAPSFLPSPEREISRYEEHNNSINDPGYVNFLKRVTDPALSFIKQGMTGLDYGCGPVPTLSRMISQKGITCYDYDPLFGFEHPFSTYDFIFSTECFEHFHNPEKEISKVIRLLKPGGYLFLMTEQWESLDRFYTWYYKRDPTHVSFFHRNTFRYLIKKYNMKEMYRDRNRVLILKNPA